jgi:hypothetical protein
MLHRTAVVLVRLLPLVLLHEADVPTNERTRVVVPWAHTYAVTSRNKFFGSLDLGTLKERNTVVGKIYRGEKATKEEPTTMD